MTKQPLVIQLKNAVFVMMDTIWMLLESVRKVIFLIAKPSVITNPILVLSVRLTILWLFQAVM